MYPFAEEDTDAPATAEAGAQNEPTAPENTQAQGAGDYFIGPMGGGPSAPQSAAPAGIDPATLQALQQRLQQALSPQTRFEQIMRSAAPIIAGAFGPSGTFGSMMNGYTGTLNNGQLERTRQAQEDLRLAAAIKDLQQQEIAQQRIEAEQKWKADQLTAANARAEQARMAADQKAQEKARAGLWQESWKNFQQGGGIEALNNMIDQNPDKANQYLDNTTLKGLAEPNGPTPTLRDLLSKVGAVQAPDGVHWLGGKPLEKPDDELAAYAKSLNKPVSELTFQERLKFHQQEAAAKKAPEADDAALQLTPQGLQMVAKQFAMTGVLPPMGMGAKATAARTKIINAAASMYDNLDLPTQVAAWNANKKSLTELTTKNDALNAFERTGKRNLDMFLGTASKVADSGVPWINEPLRNVTDRGMGSEDMAAYRAARQVALTEVARVLNNPNLTGVLSDAARAEIATLIGPDATFGQVVKAAKVLQTDMETRRQEYAAQLGEIQRRIASPPGQAQVGAGGGTDPYQDYLNRSQGR